MCRDLCFLSSSPVYLHPFLGRAHLTWTPPPVELDPPLLGIFGFRLPLCWVADVLCVAQKGQCVCVKPGLCTTAWTWHRLTDALGKPLLLYSHPASPLKFSVASPLEIQAVAVRLWS